MQTVIFYGNNCSPPVKGKVSFDRVELKQGLNELSDEFAAMLKAHPDYPRYENWKALEWIKPVAETALPGELPKDLSSYSPEDALKLIATCFNEDALKGWLQNERRKTLVTAINKRISEVKEGN